MYLCYIDESGNTSSNDNSSHFILAGLAIPIYHWKTCESDIDKIKKKYSLTNTEIHTAWLLRKYAYQDKIDNFSSLTHNQRRSEVDRLYKEQVFPLRKNSKLKKKANQIDKNYRNFVPYIHLTHDERSAFVQEIAEIIGSWGFARLFAECVNKVSFDSRIASQSMDEHAFEQIVSRFQHYLGATSRGSNGTIYGLVIHDNNPTIAKRHTELMKEFHKKGTFWNSTTNIIETPLFVDSSLTSMIQLADVCAYALRRYLENNEDVLFKHIIKRADRRGDTVVGVRHFPATNCPCTICKGHTATLISP